MAQKPFNNYIRDLAQKWLDGTITPEEEKEFASWYNRFDDEAELSIDKAFALNEITLKARIRASLDDRLKEAENANRQTPEPYGTEVRRVHFMRRGWFRATAAAAFGAILLTGAYLWMARRHSAEAVAAEYVDDRPPGGDKATLILGNGSTIVLDNALKGPIAQQGNRQISRLPDGKIVYSKLNTDTKEVLYNTLTTPRGGQSQLVLPDGTQVWLNAASSIRYPTAFTGKERDVEITGEVYFEVAHMSSLDAGKNREPVALPFKVRANNASVEVLGTHFNINAYPDEPQLKTTLLEGSIRVEQLTTHRSQLIAPGQQVQLSAAEPYAAIQVVNHVDLTQVMAWKNGFFEFDDADPVVVMRQVARWYDVDVVFEGDLHEKFGGRIGKDLPLSKLLQLLTSTGIKFRLEGRKLIVTP